MRRAEVPTTGRGERVCAAPGTFARSTVFGVNEEHPPKALSSIVVTEPGITIDVNEEHSRKAHSPIVVTESGITIDVNEEHP